MFELVEFVARADADGVLFRGYGGGDDVPDVGGNAVDGEEVEVFALVSSIGAVHVVEAGDEVSGLQVAGLEVGGFDLDAHEVSADFEDGVVLGGVAERLGDLVAEFHGFGHETKFGPLASLFVVGDVHARGFFHFVPDFLGDLSGRQ